MKKTSKTALFFGSGPVAAQSLSLLLQHQTIEAVITKQSTLSEMTEVAGDIPVLCVNNCNELEALLTEQQFSSSVGILIDFGIIVSTKIIDSFPLGIVNSHFSILPEWRGPDPITFAILSGQSTTGVSLMLLVEKMDEGPVLAYGEIAIEADDTTPTLTAKLIALSDRLLQEIIPLYLSGSVSPADQSLSKRTASYSRKLTKQDGELDWKKPAVQLEREIRAFTGWPKSYTHLANKDVIITSASTSEISLLPGEILASKSQLLIGCGEGSLEILGVQPSGKKQMPITSFLAGYGKQLH